MAAPKQKPHDLVTPTTNASESEEDLEHSSSDDSSDSEPQQQLTQSELKKTLKDTSSSDDSDDSDSSPPVKTQNTLSPRPKKPTSQLKNKNNKRPAAETVEVSKKNKNKKSKSVDKIDTGSKKNKSTMNNGDEEEGNAAAAGGGEIEDKKASSAFTRLFSEDDDIVLLQAMIDFKSDKGDDPTSNPAAFYEFVQDLLSCTVTKRQVADKIRRLKNKFFNKRLRLKKNGKDPVFSSHYEYKLFELSQKIWTSDGGQVDDGTDSKVLRSSSRKKDNKKDGNVVSNTPVGKKQSTLQEQVKDQLEVEEEDYWSLYPCLCASLKSESSKYLVSPMRPEKYVKEVISGLQRDKAVALEGEWKGFHVMEHQLYAKRVQLLFKQTEAVIQP